MTDKEFAKTMQEITPQNECVCRVGIVSIPAIIEDIKRAIDANAQFSALCLTLALVDECATIEWRKTHPEKENENNEKAYTQWVDMWESPDGIEDEVLRKKMEKYKQNKKNQRKTQNGTLPELNGQLLYKLRCSILHAVSTNIDFKKCGLADATNREIKNFALVANEPNQLLMGGHRYGCDKNKNNEMYLDIQGLVGYLLALVELYYKENKDAIDFNTISLFDFTGEYIKERKSKDANNRNKD